LSSIKITLDTNILPADDLIALVPSGQFEFAIVSVTDGEMGGSATQVDISNIPETMVWDESRFDEPVWGDSESDSCLELSLKIISDGSFPPLGKRDKLTRGARRQFRDAIIFCAHVREHRDIFVTNDISGFIKGDRRIQLEKSFHTLIMTRDEFLIQFGIK